MPEEGCRIRTDLALETQESIIKSKKDVRGIRSKEETKENGVTISTVRIDTENAARAMGKPKGRYITIEAPQLSEDDEDYHREVSKELSNILCKLIEGKLDSASMRKPENHSVLVVGLGNREVTADSLGPKVVDNLFITRHIIREYGKYAFGSVRVGMVSGLVPGVMAQTGMETVEIIRGVVKETKPDYVITIDALAARSTKRLGRTIQLTDTGIVPGSGVGNHRNALNMDSLGVPVISIGVPTVVDAATIVADAVHESRDTMKRFMSPKLNDMYVSPKDVDDTIKQLSFLISEGINMVFAKNK